MRRFVQSSLFTAAAKRNGKVSDAGRSGLVWAEPTMNLTQDVIQAIDATAAAPKPAATAAPQK